jgi:hypothetical protein
MLTIIIFALIRIMRRFRVASLSWRDFGSILIMIGLALDLGWFLYVDWTTEATFRDFISTEWFMPPVFIGAVLFYRLRGTRPIIYGVVEVLIGISAIWAGIYLSQPPFLTQGLATLGGIYIIVRGLDNFRRGLSDSARAKWDELFPQSRS